MVNTLGLDRDAPSLIHVESNQTLEGIGSVRFHMTPMVLHYAVKRMHSGSVEFIADMVGAICGK